MEGQAQKKSALMQRQDDDDDLEEFKDDDWDESQTENKEYLLDEKMWKQNWDKNESSQEDIDQVKKAVAQMKKQQ